MSLPCPQTSVSQGIHNNRRSSDAGEDAFGLVWPAPEHPRRASLEAFVRDRFQAEYDAHIQHFLPHLIGLCQGGTLQAAVGFGSAEGRPLYLEQYLHAPVEVYLTPWSPSSLTRQQIVEVGNLAALSPGTSRTLILMLTRYFHEQGVEWVVFTAIPALLNTFERFGIQLRSLSEARLADLRDSHSDWGSYYERHPQVVAGRVADGYAQLLENPVLSRLMQRLPRIAPCPPQGPES